MRDLALLRCDSEVDSANKEAFFEAVTAAFGYLIDAVPNLLSQLKLGYHKIINIHPSKNQIETNKRGSQRPGRRRSTSPNRRQEGIASSSSATVAAAVQPVQPAQPAAPQNSCCASAAVEQHMIPLQACVQPNRPPPVIEEQVNANLCWVLTIDVRDLHGFVSSSPSCLVVSDNTIQNSMWTLAHTYGCCLQLRSQYPRCAAEARLQDIVKSTLRQTIVVNGRRYKFNKVVENLLSSRCSWKYLAQTVQTEKLYTPVSGDLPC